jgi:hypothetical protein
LSLLAILAETATVRRDATHDVTGAVWTRSAPKIGLGSPASCVAQPATKMAMSFENPTQIILEEASRLNSDPTEHDTAA